MLSSSLLTLFLPNGKVINVCTILPKLLLAWVDNWSSMEHRCYSWLIFQSNPYEAELFGIIYV